MVSSTFLQFVTISLSLISLASASSSSSTSNAVEKIFKAPLIIPSVYKPLNAKSNDETPLIFTIHLRSKNLQGLGEKMTSIASSTPSSEWLTFDQLSEFTSPSTSDQEAMVQFLESNGFSEQDYEFNTLKNQVKVKSHLGKVSRLFKAQFQDYQMKETVLPRTKEFTVPKEISGMVVSISPLTVFQEVRHNIASNEKMIKKLKKKDGNGVEEVCNVDGVTPECLRTLYETIDYKPSNGTEAPDVGVMEYIDQYFSQSDLTNFLKKYRPEASSYQMPVELSNGAINLELDPSAETMLDTETVVAQIYPLNSTMYAYGNTATQGDVFQLTFDKFIETPVNLRPSILSISYGSEEASMTADQFEVMCNSAQALNALGTTIVISSGDYGVNGNGMNGNCPNFTPTYPGGCPYVLSVGASQSFSPEVAVDKSLAGFFSGAGASIYAPIPFYQKQQVSSYLKGYSFDQSHFQKGGRMFPDISAQGSKYLVELSGLERKVGGTSASAPTIASILALINDARRSKGLSRVGWVHPKLYKNVGSFTDVVSGGSYGCDDESVGFPSGENWDASMGVGTPLFSKLRQIFDA